MLQVLKTCFGTLLETPEGKALLVDLWGKVEAAMKVYHHAWKADDMLVWDNWRIEGPSFVWHYDGGLVVGLANDGIAGVPGVLRLVVETADGRVLASTVASRVARPAEQNVRENGFPTRV